ncbi:MAG: response regulator [Nitrospirae bacterium]|nr:response regulator [Nitrospirota bacterium]
MLSALIVDDSETTRSFIRSLVEDVAEIDVLEASSGFEAFRVLPAHSIDIIFVDINMPDINGIELINFLKTNDLYKKIPVIIISTERSKEDMSKGMALGAFAYLTKPVNPDELREITKKALNL